MSFLGPKLAQKYNFYSPYLIYNQPLRSQSDLTQRDHKNCIISYGIAWYWIVGSGAQDTYVLYHIQHELKRWNIDKASSFFSQNQPKNTSTSAVIFCRATTWTPNKSCTTKQPAVVLLLCPLPFSPSRLVMFTQMIEQVLSSCHQWTDGHLLIFHKI